MITTLSQPPVDTPLDASNGSVDVSRNIDWTKWFSLIFNILLNVGPRMMKVAAVTFPPCPPFSSVDVAVPFAGVAPNSKMTVTLGIPADLELTVNNGYLAFISADDVVTIRQFCCDPFGILAFTDTFAIIVLTGEPNVA